MILFHLVSVIVYPNTGGVRKIKSRDARYPPRGGFFPIFLFNCGGGIVDGCYSTKTTQDISIIDRGGSSIFMLRLDSIYIVSD